MLRFVLLYHRCPPAYTRPSHWDLMLECGDMLRTWALSHLPLDWQIAHKSTHRKDCECPLLAAGNEVEAMQLADHRQNYLDYEGELSGERGSVIRVAAGTYRLRGETPVCITFEFNGDELTGCYKLICENERADRWTLIRCETSTNTAG